MAARKIKFTTRAFVLSTLLSTPLLTSNWVAAQTGSAPQPSSWIGLTGVDKADGTNLTLIEHAYFQHAYSNDEMVNVPGYGQVPSYSPKRYNLTAGCQWYGSRGLTLRRPDGGSQDYVFFNAACAQPRSIVAFMIPAENLPSEPSDKDFTVYYCLDTGEPKGATQRANTFTWSENGYEVQTSGVREKTVSRVFTTSLCGLDPIQDKGQHMLNEMFQEASTISARPEDQPNATEVSDSSNAALPQLTDADSVALAETFLRADSQEWFFNKYALGSARNPRLRQVSEETLSVNLLADYSLTSGLTQTVAIAIRDGEFACIEFSDQPGSCRNLRVRVPKESVVEFVDLLFDGAATRRIEEANAPEKPYELDPEILAELQPYLEAEGEKRRAEYEALPVLPSAVRQWKRFELQYRSKFDWLGGAGLDRAIFNRDTSFPQETVKNPLDTRPINYFKDTFALDHDTFWDAQENTDRSRKSATAQFNSLVQTVSRPTIVSGDLRLYFASGLTRSEVVGGLAACQAPQLTYAQICDCAAGFPGQTIFGAGAGNGILSANTNAGAQACSAAIAERASADQPPSPFLEAQLARLEAWQGIWTGSKMTSSADRGKVALEAGNPHALVIEPTIAALRFRTSATQKNYDEAIAQIKLIRTLYPADAYALSLIVEDVASAARLTNVLVDALINTPPPGSEAAQAGRDEEMFHAIKKAERDYYRYQAPRPTP
ncbi:MAG: hypothetical protein AAFR51_17510 [Pseudomonadota bacterium]